MSRPDLKQTLEELYLTFRVNYLSMDPLEIVRRYKDPRDKEVVGFIAAAFALGRVDFIRKNLNDLFSRLGPSPYRFILEFDPFRHGKVFEGFVYRFYRDRDLGVFVWWMKQILEADGSLSAFFLSGYNEKEENVGPCLSRFVRKVLSLKTRPFYSSLPPRGSGIRHFLADPTHGSGCKRLNLFLRWMVRRDGLDLGLWQEVSPSKLVIPLDTHITRLGRYLGLTRRTTPGWRMALEITDSLKRFDPEDPVKYDFALCRVGMLNLCPAESGHIKCIYNFCPVFSYCTMAKII